MDEFKAQKLSATRRRKSTENQKPAVYHGLPCRENHLFATSNC
ncbi:hypothetical protein [Marinobacter gelidimuriae]|nr:hypothetical protein [Marinobacter gelidimuriae]